MPNLTETALALILFAFMAGATLMTGIPKQPNVCRAVIADVGVMK